MTQTQKHWAWALLYVALIYATLGIVGRPLSFLRSHGLLRITLSFLYFSCFVWVLGVIIKRSSTEKWRYAALIGIFALYFLIARYVKSPEEQIHFFQYGLVGVLFHQALQNHRIQKWKIFPLALLLASAAGWWDEILQGFLPHRHYDIRDIYLNAISAFLGLLLYQFILPQRPPSSQ